MNPNVSKERKENINKILFVNNSNRKHRKFVKSLKFKKKGFNFLKKTNVY